MVQLEIKDFQMNILLEKTLRDWNLPWRKKQKVPTNRDQKIHWINNRDIQLQGIIMNELNYVYCDFVTGVKCRLIKLYTNTNDWRHDKTEAKTNKAS
jgi:hypothetical protein